MKQRGGESANQDMNKSERVRGTHQLERTKVRGQDRKRIWENKGHMNWSAERACQDTEHKRTRGTNGQKSLKVETTTRDRSRVMFDFDPFHGQILSVFLSFCLLMSMQCNTTKVRVIYIF